MFCRDCKQESFNFLEFKDLISGLSMRPVEELLPSPWRNQPIVSNMINLESLNCDLPQKKLCLLLSFFLSDNGFTRFAFFFLFLIFSMKQMVWGREGILSIMLYFDHDFGIFFWPTLTPFWILEIFSFMWIIQSSTQEREVQKLFSLLPV